MPQDLRETASLIVGGFPLLEFDRAPLDRDRLIGFVLGWSEEFTLIHVVDHSHFLLNGYLIFRNSDVKRWRSVAKDEFVARAAKLNRLRPIMPEGVCYTSMKEAVASVGSSFPLITLYQECIDRKVCYVGKLLRTNQRAVTILSISPEAEWEEEERYQLRDITRLEFGGAYENLLTRMAP